MKLIRILGLIFVLCIIIIEAKAQVEIHFNPDSVLLFAQKQYLKAVAELDTAKGMPRNGNSDGSWNQVKIEDWTSGFFPGTLWYLYEHTGDEALKNAAEKWTIPLSPIQNYDGNHDIGFMIFCSFGNAYRLTAENAYKDIILNASAALSTRYRPAAKSILSWGNIHQKNPRQHTVIIDNMMNLEMLEWASKNGGAARYDEIARNHADVTMKHHFRKDFSSYHVVEYDPNNGKVLSKHTSQGFADESLWSRGQSWGIYGFTMMYRETKNKKYLKTALNLSRAYVKRLPGDFVAYWDFDDPKIPNAPRDAASAAIAASAFLELFQLTGDKVHYNNAVYILNSLASDAYLAKQPGYSCVLLHCVGNMPRLSEIDVNINYADYYFIEAMLRLKKLSINKI